MRMGGRRGQRGREGGYSRVPTDTCSTCGRDLDLHDRHVRFTLPDPVLDSAEREAASGTWLSHGTARDSVMMYVPAFGAFVRALLPIRLADGHTLTYGVWLGVDPRKLQSIIDVWWAPEYRDLRLRGRLANAIRPWGLLGTPVDTVVRDPDETPYCDHSDDPDLDRVLHSEWPHDVLPDTS
jgi:hypothetical protein